jgi:hypothetical protein
MNVGQSLHRFCLNHDFAFDQEINSLTAIQFDGVVDQRQGFLLFNDHSFPKQFIAKAFQI